MYWRKPEPAAVLPPHSRFDRRLQYLMIRYGYTAASLARKTGIKESTIRSWSKGERNVKGIDRLIQLADLFDVTLDWLLGRTEEGGPI